MKTIIMALAILFATTTTMAQAKQSGKHHHGTMAKMYTCPMHPEVMKSKPGKCPECGMKLVKATASQAAYQCPMKCEGEKTYSKAGKCPECGMTMKKMNKGEIKSEKRVDEMKM